MSEPLRGESDGRKEFADSAELRAHVRALTGDTAILGMSCGKDALATYLALRPVFPRIVLYHLYLVPGLEFVEEGLRYFEDKIGQPIIRLPHPSLYRMLRLFVFQPPGRLGIIEAAKLPNLDYPDIYDHVRRVSGAPDAWVATGTRAADSPIRLANIRRNGPLSYRQRTWFPVYDWRIADVEREIRAVGWRLPVDYRMFGRSFDGLDYRFLAPIRQHYPRDYQRILDWFPLAELEFFRRQAHVAR